MKRQQRQREAIVIASVTGEDVAELASLMSAADGATTGPTIAGCSFSDGNLQLSFNASLLGGEGLMLRPFDANATGGWGHPGDPYARPITDANGAMVCTVDPDCRPQGNQMCGNATTCQCQSWNYMKVGYCNASGCPQSSVWYCEVGPGWKPPLQQVAAEARRRQQERRAEASIMEAMRPSGGAELLPHSQLGWVPSSCPFERQWSPVPLRATASAGHAAGGKPATTVEVDLSGPDLQGRVPIAVRLAWPLFGIPYSPSDTCCPTASIQAGRGVCIPGNCPLYSSVSELPANPFFATITGGKCRCAAPQHCSL